MESLLIWKRCFEPVRRDEALGVEVDGKFKAVERGEAKERVGEEGAAAASARGGKDAALLFRQRHHIAIEKEVIGGIGGCDDFDLLADARFVDFFLEGIYILFVLFPAFPNALCIEGVALILRKVWIDGGELAGAVEGNILKREAYVRIGDGGGDLRFVKYALLAKALDDGLLIRVVFINAVGKLMVFIPHVDAGFFAEVAALFLLFGIDVVAIQTADERDAVFVGESEAFFVDGLLPAGVVRLHFEIEGIAKVFQKAEDIGGDNVISIAFAAIVPKDGLVFLIDFAPSGDAGSGDENVFGREAREQFYIDARDVVITGDVGLGECGGDLAATGFVAGEQDDVGVGIVLLMAVEHPVGFRAKDIFEGSLAFFEGGVRFFDRFPDAQVVALRAVVDGRDDLLIQFFRAGDICLALGENVAVLEGSEDVGKGIVLMVILHDESSSLSLP